MTRFSYLTAAMIVAGTAASASASEIELFRPMQAGVLNEVDADMVIYYVDAAPGVDVIATYAGRDDPENVRRVRMHLSEGDRVSFALPGSSRTVYSFASNGENVTVRTEATPPVVSNVTQ